MSGFEGDSTVFHVEHILKKNPFPNFIYIMIKVDKLGIIFVDNNVRRQ